MDSSEDSPAGSGTDGTDLARLAGYIRVGAAADPADPLTRLTRRIGPFLATVMGGDANPYLSYAVPDDVAALNAWFSQQGRTPRRLE